MTFRVLDFPDLTVDGSLPLGAAVSAAIISNGGNPFFSVAAAFVAGVLAGAFTGIISTKLRILNLLAGILTMIALYSINIRIMGSPNLTLLNLPSMFRCIPGTGNRVHRNTYGRGVPGEWFLIKIVLDLFLHTNFGLALRATGDNPKMVTAQGVNTDTVIVAGVAFSNGLVAVSGSLLAQSQGSADVGMGVGTIIAGLASVIIGEAFVGERSVVVSTLGVVLGSVLYRLAIATALSVRFGSISLTPSDLNLITAALVIAALTFPQVRHRLRSRALD